MNIFEARLLKLKIIQALQAAGCVQHHKLYIKLDNLSEVEALCNVYKPIKFFIASERYPIYALDDDFKPQNASDLKSLEDISDVRALLKPRNISTRCVALIAPEIVDSDIVEKIKDIVKIFWLKIHTFKPEIQKLTWSIGIGRRITGEYNVSVKVFTANTLGKSAPLPRLLKILLDHFGNGDRGSVMVTNPITPAFTNSWAKWCQKSHDTARPGIQIGVHGHGASTVTAKFLDPNSDNNWVLLGSGHGVFAPGDSSKSVAVHQPNLGQSFGVAQRDKSHFPSRFGQRVVADYSYIKISEGFSSENRFDEGLKRKTIAGTREVEAGAEVYTLGATSGLVSREITSKEEDIEIILGDGHLVVMLDHMISLAAAGAEIRSGDSGGPVLLAREGMKEFDLVGIVVAGRSKSNSPNRQVLSVMTPIENIIDLSRLELFVDK